MEIKIYRGATLKEGAFICVKNKLHKGDKYLSIRWFEKVLTDKFSLPVLKLMTIFVAFQDGKAIGCGVVYPWVQDRKDDTRLLSVFVLPKYRKNKVGSELLKKMRAQDYPFRTRLVCHTDNRIGSLFYKKHSVEKLKP